MMTVNIIGSGNVATHLALELYRWHYNIWCIGGRDITKASDLAFQMRCLATSNISDLMPAELTIIAVSDNAIEEVVSKLYVGCKMRREIVVHTSGATPMSVLDRFPRHGVLYPCMTFTKGDDLDMWRCPFLVEACNKSTYNAIARVAKNIGHSAKPCDSEGRRRVHLAAVLASNFTNHMMLKAEQVLKEAKLPLSILQPLVWQTIEKAFKMPPFDAQTGPARRNDTATMERHREIIGDDERLREIYDAVSRSIMETYRGKE